METNSTDYHDYVIKGGKFIGKFDEMYRYSSEIPWHQDRTVQEVFTEIDLAVLRFFHKKNGFMSVCDVGCGLGYVTDRLRRESLDPSVKLTGIDVSTEAITKAKEMFDDIQFIVKDILKDNLEDLPGNFDLVIFKELLWYVMGNVEVFFQKLLSLTQKYIYISQSFPEGEEFLGSEIFSTPHMLRDFLSEKITIIHSCIEKDARFGNRELIHVFGEKL